MDTTQFVTRSIVNGNSLRPFFVKLDKINKQKLQIIHWGDSHIQMGYFAKTFRQGLDSLYGVTGYGSTFPYRLAKYNPFHSFTRVNSGQWIGGNILKKDLNHLSGITGFWGTTLDSSASIEFGLRSMPMTITGYNQVTVFYQMDEKSTLFFKAVNSLIDTSIYHLPVLSETKKIDSEYGTYYSTKLLFDGDIDRIGIDIKNTHPVNGFTVHGAFFEKAVNYGLVYNNCAVGGAQFNSQVDNGPLSLLQAKSVNPDLIILSFGSNESYLPEFNDSMYRAMIRNYLKKIKSEIPDASILLTGPPDTRSKNRYPRNTASICSILQEIALLDGYAYFDFRKAMGGDGSILAWLKKGWASTDKLHFTPAGYSIQANWLISALNNEYSRYKETNTHE